LTTLRPLRGTHDLLGDDARRHRHVVDRFYVVAGRYGFTEIATPILEYAEVFRRTLGESSDVVTKEMYSFNDRGGDEVTMRPEYTAGVARAFISGGLGQQLPLKFLCHGPMFRYERPQKGRLRQFHQIDVEVLGVSEPLGDIEVIALAAHLLEDLGIAGQTRLELNSLGDKESRASYRKALVDYLLSHADALSPTSRVRLERNPMRILDSKDENDRRILQDAPLLEDYLNGASRDFFAQVRAGLDRLGIVYQINQRLVRGLDYYGHTAFEYTTDALGAQGAVIAGGRYDGLIETMGGPPTPGVGWAGGIERLALLLSSLPSPSRPVAVIPVGADEWDTAISVAHELRHAGVPVELAYRGNLSKRLKRANKLNARAAVIIGEDELRDISCTLRDLDTGVERRVSLADLKVQLVESR
jgi:histidyl-tRNA synthetase